MIRIIHNKPYNCHTNELFKISKILKLPDLYKLQLSKFMYKHTNLSLPGALRDIFTPNRAIHDYNTRNRNDPCIQLHKSNIVHQNITHCGPLLWNNIPNKVKQTPTMASFKRNYKSILLDKY